MKIIKFGLLFLLALVVIFLVIKFFPKSSIEVIKIGYSVQESIPVAPLIIAYEKDFFQKEGLVVQMIPLKNGGEIAQALASGSLDVGALGMSSLLVPISKGAPVVVIAPISLFSVDFYVRPNEINIFKELVGKRIASRPGGSADFVIRYVLRKEGVDVKQIKFIDVDRAFRPVALMQRDVVDGAAVVSYDTTAFTESGAVLMKEWNEKGYNAVTSIDTAVGFNVAVNTNYLETHENTIEKFITAYIEGHRYIQTNRSDAALILGEHTTRESSGAFTYTTDDVLGLWNKQKNTYQLWYSPEALQGLFDIAKNTSAIDYIPTVTEYYNQQFKGLLKAEQQQIYGQKN